MRQSDGGKGGVASPSPRRVNLGRVPSLAVRAPKVTLPTLQCELMLKKAESK